MQANEQGRWTVSFSTKLAENKMFSNIFMSFAFLEERQKKAEALQLNIPRIQAGLN